MKFPNKLYSYEESTISKFPTTLKYVNTHPYSVSELYGLMEKHVDGISEFLNILDCLYAMGRIEINEEGVISYVAAGD